MIGQVAPLPCFPPPLHAGRLRASVEVVALADSNGRRSDLVDELAVRVAMAAMDMGLVVSIRAQIVDSGPPEAGRRGSD